MLSRDSRWPLTAFRSLKTVDLKVRPIHHRLASGRVLARQLVAIAESDRLICFSVYPVTANELLANAFHAFDQAMAKTLGIEMYRRQDEDNYDIAIILAQSYWDDGAWEHDEQVPPPRT